MNIGEIEKSVDYEMVKVKIGAKQFNINPKCSFLVAK